MGGALTTLVSVVDVRVREASALMPEAKSGECVDWAPCLTSGALGATLRRLCPRLGRFRRGSLGRLHIPAAGR